LTDVAEVRTASIVKAVMRLHGAIYQKVVIFILAALKT
jgi:hypothetical protein